jgi:hypothetical protein
MPDMPTPGQQQITNDQDQLQHVRWEQANPWGTAENHPGKLGKLAHTFATIGNIAGNVVAPDVMARIPNTQLNLQEREGDLAKRLNTEITNEGENEQREASTRKANEETAELPGKTQSEEQLQEAQSKNLESETANRGTNLADAYAHRVSAVIAQGGDPSQDPIVKHLEDRITAIQKQPAPKGAHFIQREVNGKPHTIAVDDLTGEDIRDEGETGEKPPTVNVNAGLAALDRETARMAKPYEKGVSDASSQLEKIADARAMINGPAEAQALGIPKVLTALVSGQGSGVRITQPELNAIAKARGVSGDVEGFINSVSGKGKLTDTQKKQLTGILDDVKARVVAKQNIHSETLDKINGAASREDVVTADKEARQKLKDLEQHGFYVGQVIPGHGTVVGFTKEGKVQVDDAH